MVPCFVTSTFRARIIFAWRAPHWWLRITGCVAALSALLCVPTSCCVVNVDPVAEIAPACRSISSSFTAAAATLFFSFYFSLLCCFLFLPSWLPDFFFSSAIRFRQLALRWPFLWQ